MSTVDAPTTDPSDALATDQPVGASAANRRRIVLGLTDQVVFALGSAGMTFLATAVTSNATQAGSVMLAILTLNFAMGVSRAFIGEAVLAHVSRFDGLARRKREQDALATALIVGPLWAVALLGLWLFGPANLFGYMVWGLPFLPMLLLHDTGRNTYLAAREQGSALTIDLAWILTQALVLCVCWLAGWWQGGTLFVAWGIGATVGATLFLARSRLNPWRGRLGAWFAETKHLSGWFVGSALVGQSQTMTVAFTVGHFLTEAGVAGLRLAQAAILQPVQNLVTAMNALMVPRFSRFAAAGDLPALRRLALKVAGLSLALGGTAIVTVVLLAEPILDWYLGGRYAYVAPLALPVAIQAAIYLLQIPFTSALRGMQRAKLLFAQYLIFTTTSLTGAFLGAIRGSLLATTWGLTLGAAVGFVVMVVLYLSAARPTPSP